MTEKAGAIEHRASRGGYCPGRTVFADIGANLFFKTGSVAEVADGFNVLKDDITA